MNNKLPNRLLGMLCLGLAAVGLCGTPTPRAVAQDADQASAVEAPDDSTEATTETATEQPAANQTSPGGPPIQTPDAGETIDATRDQLEKWVETRRIIAQEKQDLRLAKEMLNERVALVQNEIQALKDKIAEAQQSIAKTDDQFNALTSDDQKLKQASDLLLATVKQLEGMTQRLLASTPAPVSKRVEVLSQQIPDDPDNTTLPLASRFQNVIGILNEVNKFNSEITVTSEMRDLPDRGENEVTVMYLGVSKAFYVGGNSKFGGVGTPSEQGWVWQAMDEVAGRIALVIDIYNNKQVAQFVELPIDIK